MRCLNVVAKNFEAWQWPAFVVMMADDGSRYIVEMSHVLGPSSALFCREPAQYQSISLCQELAYC